MRECPFCLHLQRGNPSEPKMICEKCSREYCFIHSNAHPGQTCKEYERSHWWEFRKNKRAAGKGAKECPGCGIVVMKSEGCNHMTCRCGFEFCYVCGADIRGNVSGHFVFGCSQYDDNILKMICLHPEINSYSVIVWRIFLAFYTYAVFGPLILCMMGAILPFYILFSIICHRPGLSICGHLFRWARYAEGTIVALLAFTSIVSFGPLALIFSMCIQYSMMDSSDKCSDSINCAFFITGRLVCGLIMLIVFLLYFPLMVILFCFGCCCCLVTDCESEFEFERDVIQLPFLALYGMDAVENWHGIESLIEELWDGRI